MGLEPFTSYPTRGLEEAIRNGTAASIEPEGTLSFTMKANPYKL
ncbi:hypothetical protein WMW72_10450 [Paenibacillus filicis]|uniref:Uncharacterized protein n=1 Tax=Paenibacillus filicis TaxID=669464 RepID=A0ABU9DHT9_9BACL